MQRRQFILSSIGQASLLALPAVWMSPGYAQTTEAVRHLGDALRWLDQLEAAPGVKTSGVWALPAILEHLSQSIEMSLEGFPQPKSALFQNTVGTAAFSVFKWRGRMSHALSEPIPGAPPLTSASAALPAAQRLRAAITRFQAHTGALKPHFAYGQLSKADYSVAHTLHIANHQDEIAIHRLA
jgi:hypothetical protein